MDQVFVDPSGRRRRLARAVGIAVGCLLAAYMAVVASGLFTGSGTPFTPWPGRTPRAAPPPGGGSARPSHPPTRRPSPRPTTAPRPARTTHTAGSSPRPTATAREHGRGYGLTKSPNPRKPTG